MNWIGRIAQLQAQGYSYEEAQRRVSKAGGRAHAKKARREAKQRAFDRKKEETARAVQAEAERQERMGLR